MACSAGYHCDETPVHLSHLALRFPSSSFTMNYTFMRRDVMKWWPSRIAACVASLPHRLTCITCFIDIRRCMLSALHLSSSSLRHPSSPAWSLRFVSFLPPLARLSCPCLAVRLLEPSDLLLPQVIHLQTTRYGVKRFMATAHACDAQGLQPVIPRLCFLYRPSLSMGGHNAQC